MDRRNFLCNLTTATAVGATAIEASDAKPDTKGALSVQWNVKGFTCITCAVGLEVMLRGFKGVVMAKATYPENKVSIQYDPKLVTDAKLREFIQVCGFQVA